MFPERALLPRYYAAFANRRITSFSCPDRFPRTVYLVLFDQSSINHGHQLLGLPCVVPFLMTLTFMILLPFCFS